MLQYGMCNYRTLLCAALISYYYTSKLPGAHCIAVDLQQCRICESSCNNLPILIPSFNLINTSSRCESRDHLLCASTRVAWRCTCTCRTLLGFYLLWRNAIAAFQGAPSILCCLSLGVKETPGDYANLLHPDVVLLYHGLVSADMRQFSSPDGISTVSSR